MDTNNKYRGETVRKLILVWIFAALTLPMHSFALGLGDIQVNSNLNQQLDARIDVLSATPEDTDTLIIKLASREEFSKAGVDRPHELTALKFKTLVEDERVYVTVKSPKPVREPSLIFLLEVDWPKGHLIRQYTILLEPPAFMRQKTTRKATLTSKPAATHEEMSVEQSSSEIDGFRPAQQP